MLVIIAWVQVVLRLADMIFYRLVWCLLNYLLCILNGSVLYLFTSLFPCHGTNTNVIDNLLRFRSDKFRVYTCNFLFQLVNLFKNNYGALYWTLKLIGLVIWLAVLGVVVEKDILFVYSCAMFAAGVPSWAYSRVQVYAVLAVCGCFCWSTDWWHHWVPWPSQ